MINRSAFKLKPYECKFTISNSFGRHSKAFGKSVWSAPKNLPLSTADFYFSINARRKHFFQYTYRCIIIFRVFVNFFEDRNHIWKFGHDGKWPLLIEALNEGWTKSVNMSSFTLIIFVSWQALEASKQTISWKISFFATFEKLNKPFDFWTLSMVFILGWYILQKLVKQDLEFYYNKDLRLDIQGDYLLY